MRVGVLWDNKVILLAAKREEETIYLYLVGKTRFIRALSRIEIIVILSVDFLRNDTLRETANCAQ